MVFPQTHLVVVFTMLSLKSYFYKRIVKKKHFRNDNGGQIYHSNFPYGILKKRMKSVSKREKKTQ